MKTVSLLSFVLLAGAITRAAEPIIVELWPGMVPGDIGIKAEEKSRIHPSPIVGATKLITNVSKPTLTIYPAPPATNTGTAILICPGGGYWKLYWELEGEEIATWLNSIGVTGIILKYRVPRRPGEPEKEPARRPLQDAQRAISLIRSKAGEWGIARVGIAGFSAGGHLVMATATSFDKRTYDPVDEIDKISSRPDFGIAVYSGYLRDELARNLHVPTNTPPIFLAHGGEDIISSPEESVSMYLALKRAGVPTELHIYAGAAHDFGVRPSEQPCTKWTEHCAEWLRHQGWLRKP